MATIAAFPLAPIAAREQILTPKSDLKRLSNEVQPGDTLLLADGIWKDLNLRFDSLRGTANEPIHIRAESPGKVVLTGTTTLAISGQYVVVSGLVIRNPQQRSDVVQFRTHSKRHAHHCRMTECVFIETDSRRLASNHAGCQSTARTTKLIIATLAARTRTSLVVWVNENPQHHVIHQNFFGPRPILGQNGGETIRIGTSDTCHLASNTIVRRNYFLRCNGEAEIISNKSCENVYRYNSFVECSGALTLRHGHRCQVDHNAFLGNKKRGTGGVRIIGRQHKVVQNYFSGLRGDAERAAVSFMNGIPDSSADGDGAVKSAWVESNTFVDCKVSIEIGVGAVRNAVGSPYRMHVRRQLVPARKMGDLSRTCHTRRVHLGKTMCDRPAPCVARNSCDSNRKISNGD